MSSNHEAWKALPESGEEGNGEMREAWESETKSH